MQVLGIVRITLPRCLWTTSWCPFISRSGQLLGDGQLIMLRTFMVLDDVFTRLPGLSWSMISLVEWKSSLRSTSRAASLLLQLEKDNPLELGDYHHVSLIHSFSKKFLQGPRHLSSARAQGSGQASPECVHQRSITSSTTTSVASYSYSKWFSFLRCFSSCSSLMFGMIGSLHSSLLPALRFSWIIPLVTVFIIVVVFVREIPSQHCSSYLLWSTSMCSYGIWPTLRDHHATWLSWDGPSGVPLHAWRCHHLLDTS